MHIVTIAWIFVVGLMALVEAASPNGTVLGAVITLVLYGALPLGIVLYVMGAPARRKRRLMSDAAGSGPPETDSRTSSGDPIDSALADPDSRGVTPRDHIAPVREEP